MNKKQGLSKISVILYVVLMVCLLAFWIFMTKSEMSAGFYDSEVDDSDNDNIYYYNEIFQNNLDYDPEYNGSVEDLGYIVDIDNNSDIINIPSDSFETKRFLSQRVYYASMNNPNAKIYVTNEISKENFDYTTTMSNYGHFDFKKNEHLVAYPTYVYEE